MYKAPVMKFEEITFFERIATNCWSSTNFYFDNPFTRKRVEQDLITINCSKCGDLESWSAIYQALDKLCVIDQLKYFVYALFACDKQSTKMWGFSVVPS